MHSAIVISRALQSCSITVLHSQNTQVVNNDQKLYDGNRLTLIVLEYDTGTFPMLTVAKNTAETFPKESGKIPVINKPEINWFEINSFIEMREQFMIFEQ